MGDTPTGRPSTGIIAALGRACERIGREVADLDVRRTLFTRLVRSDLLAVIREGGPAAADARIEALLLGIARGRALIRAQR